MADQNQLTPAQRYNATLEDQIRGLSSKFLTRLYGEEAATKAAAKIGLAMRQAALASPDIWLAGPEAIANAISMCALLDLTPGGQHADCWLFPKGGSSGGMQFMVSHRGIVKLARRSGYEVRAVNVHQGDDYDFVRTPFPEFHHRPKNSAPTWDTLVRTYCFFWPKDDREAWDVYVLEKNELERRKSAQTAGPVWKSWGLEMALKSTIKAAASRGLFPLEAVARDAMDTIDAEDNTPVIDTTARPAPERPATPPRRMTATEDLDARLGPDEDDQGRAEPEPVAAVAAAEEPKKRTRGPNRPKPETAATDTDKLNEQHELLIRLTEGEKRQPDGGVKLREKHGIGIAASRSLVVQIVPGEILIPYIKELES